MIKIEDWIASSGLQLEPNANRAARSTEGSIALLAGPGAGKTEMLAQRADFLLRTGSCHYPRRILAISFKKDASENLKKRVERRCGWELASRFDSYTFHAFAKRLIDIFRSFLSGTDELNEDYSVGPSRVKKTQITFNDMVPLANEIVSNCPEARNSIRQAYSDVFLDEFQDCTDAQYKLIKNAFLGHDARLVAVGDTKQKIMGWAGALDGIFLQFGRDFKAVPLNLYQNFRSLPRIRRVHNEMIIAIDPTAAVDAALIASEGGVVSIKGFSDDVEEALWIGESVRSWAESGTPLSEIAILCNTQPHLYARSLMEVFKDMGIPVRNEQEVQDLFCEPIYRLIVDYLVVVLGSSEPDAWERLFSILVPDIYTDMEDLWTRGWSQFIQEKSETLKGSTDFAPIWDAVDEMIAKLGSETVTGLSHDYENRARLQELVDLTKLQVRNCFQGDGLFLEQLKSLSEINAVRVLTIHKCKGLEFDTVIVQGVENETFFSKEKDANECGFFVAISRAKKRLVVTHAGQRTKHEGANAYWRVSRSPHGQFLGYVSPHVGGIY